MPKSRMSASLYLLLVFVSGILLGTVSHRLYDATSARASSSPNMTEFRKRYLAEMRDRVHVDDKQITAVVQHLDDAKRRFDDLKAQEQPLHDRIQQEMVDEIRNELTNEQKPLYDKWHAERMARQTQSKKNP